VKPPTVRNVSASQRTVFISSSLRGNFAITTRAANAGGRQLLLPALGAMIKTRETK
jgi:hypothetical protein